MILKCNYHLISEDEDEDFSKGAEEFVEAARKRRIERKSGEGTLQNVCYNWLDSISQTSLQLSFPSSNTNVVSSQMAEKVFSHTLV